MKIKRIIFSILIIINCMVIFNFSGQDSEKSTQTSGVIVNQVVDTIAKINKNTEKEEVKDTVTFVVRKTAHFSIYTLLGIFLMNLANTFDIAKKRKILLCLTFGLLYASSDEFHQSFIGGRSPEIRDVCIDTCGVLFGCLLVILIVNIVTAIKRTKKSIATSGNNTNEGKKMRVLITGASSGIGKDLAFEFAKKGYDLILVARNLEKLNQVKKEIQNVNVQIIQMDISIANNCKKLYEHVGDTIDILINNAGFGVFGKFDEIDLDKEIQLINTNIMAVDSLTKLFLIGMKQKNSGYILNVASIAGFLPGPLMSSYYASKAYVVRLSEAIREELKRDKSKVKIGILCPGPVNTNFNNVADVKFKAKALSSEYVAKYTVKQMMKNKFYIVPGSKIKCLRFIVKIIPNNVISKFAYNVQQRKKS